MLQVNFIRQNKEEVIDRLRVKNFDAAEIVESLLQQCDPALLLVDTIGRADAVAQNQDDLSSGRRGRGDEYQEHDH